MANARGASHVFSWTSEPPTYAGGRQSYMSSTKRTPKGRTLLFRIEPSRSGAWNLVMVVQGTRNVMGHFSTIAQAKAEVPVLHRENEAFEKEDMVKHPEKNPKAAYIFKKGWPSGWDVWETGPSSAAAGAYLGHVWTRDGAYYGQVKAPSILGPFKSRGAAAKAVERAYREQWKGMHGGARQNPAKGDATQTPEYLTYRKVVDAAEAEMMRKIAPFAGKPLAERRAAMNKAREEYDRIADAAWDAFKATKKNPRYATDFVAPDTAKVVKLFSKSGFTDIHMKKLANPRRLSREEFERRYWKKSADTPQGAAGVPASTRREFYSDYRESGLSFAAYEKATTSQANPRHTARPAPSAKRERAHRNPGPRAYAHLGYTKDWHPKYGVGKAVYKTLHVGPFDLPLRGKVTRICKRGEGRLGTDSYSPHYDVTWEHIGKGAEKKLLTWAKNTAGHAWVHPNILHPEPERAVPETYLRGQRT